MPYRLRTIVIVLALLSNFSAAMALRAAETGLLRMRFLYEGQPPPLNVRGPDGRKADESLIINNDNRGIGNVAVWLLRTPGDLFAVDNDDEREWPKHLMTIQSGNFSPRVAILRTPQTLIIHNADPWVYSLMADGQPHNRPFNTLLKPGESMEKRFEFKEAFPLRLTSSIQPWLNGCVLVLDHPHAAVSDADGRLVIKGIPTGNWGFVVWHERQGVVKKAFQDGQSIEWPGGVLWCKIEQGENDLGQLMLPPEQFHLR